MNVENGSCIVSKVDEKSWRNGSVRLPYKLNNATSCQATIVRRGTTDEVVQEAALFQAGHLDKCVALMFFSKVKEARYLTVEVVQAPETDATIASRREKGYYEIINSRSGILNLVKQQHTTVGNSRIRICFGGNIQSAFSGKLTRYTFIFSPLSKKNYIQFQTNKAGTTGTPYSIVTVMVGESRVHEVHFDYPEAGESLKGVKNLFKNLYTEYCPSLAGSATMTATMTCLTSSSLGPRLDTGYNTCDSRKQSSQSEVFSGLGPTTPPADVRERAQTIPPADVREQAQTTPLADVTEQVVLRDLPDVRPKIPAPFHSRDERPVTSSTVSSKDPKPVHPIFSEVSLSNFGKNIPSDVCNELLIQLGFSLDKIKKIVKEAGDNNHSSEFLLLLRWYQEKRIDIPDFDLIKDLKRALKEISRGDYVDAIRKAENGNRALEKSDFD